MTKVAIITGAAQGIGEAAAKRLHQDGFKVAILDFNLEGAEKVAQAVDGIAVKVDVSDREDVYRAVGEVVDQLGSIDVMVNNAGVAPGGPLMAMREDDVNKSFAVNAGGVLWGIQAAADQFIKQGKGGKIINASSQAGIVGNQGIGLYGATKFAVRGLTQTAAQELAEHKIAVNAYAPGSAVTPMLKASAHEIAQEAGQDDQWALDQFAQGVTMGRLAEPEDIAKVIAFLASDDANYITGQTIVVDGGTIFH
ncbi:acetoin reductase [Aerococcus kribbianus]|uniref:diacetyl reductase [(S)-acetoin forming] n=1 Tax=Aerococcus kribbianus TaxID=2999064 RepID=A0A9X3JFQ8_9LACT|nr:MULTISPECIES: acetoin reductase [unclassified Aerococcus]MCZ0717322.1 acetoin reductase [Aerococcus sp. YH-aer221]MCZ0725610.1 acetoin reductase [Aerococcus sp. YH-aer222]